MINQRDSWYLEFDERIGLTVAVILSVLPSLPHTCIQNLHLSLAARARQLLPVIDYVMHFRAKKLSLTMSLLPSAIVLW